MDERKIYGACALTAALYAGVYVVVSIAELIAPYIAEIFVYSGF